MANHITLQIENRLHEPVFLNVAPKTMAIRKLDIAQFLLLAQQHPVLDVRSPGEFAHAAIPGAHSLPLFTDEERKIVGTAYKQQSREQAIKIGLDYFGPKMRPMIETVEALLKDQPDKTVLVHCWRGGMRSVGVAWLLDLYGFKVYTLEGGYKAFRHYLIAQFKKDWPMAIIGGYTGSGKTALLEKLGRLGEAVIDLEALAAHKGSSFGHLGQPPQPSQEMFENLLGLQLLALAQTHAGKTIWLEDESLRIGSILIPTDFYKQMRRAQCYFLEISFEQRLQYILKDYGKADRENLVQAVMRIQKRLGGLETKTAINCLVENDLRGAFEILLKYYDKWYLKGLYNRDTACPPIISLQAEEVDETRNAQLLLNLKKD